MKVYVTTLGTWGDILPFMKIAKALKERGHEVIMLTNEKFRKNIEKEKIDFHAVADEESLNNALNYIVNDGLVWESESKNTSNLKKVIESTSTIFIKPSKAIYDYIEKTYKKGDTVIVSNYLCYSSRYVQDKLNIPVISTVLVPFYFRSKKRPPEQAMMPREKPAFMKYLGEKFFNDLIMYKRLFTDYEELDMKKYSKYKRRFSPNKVVCLVPEFIAKPQSDWPKQTVCLGFPENVLDDNNDYDESIVEFAKNERPILFSLGSQYRKDSKIILESVKTCELLGEKAIFLGCDKEKMNIEESESFKFVKYFPISKIIEYCSLLVCHGGIGTCTEAFRKGVPILIVPEFPEHWDTAYRIEELGLGLMLNRNDYVANTAKDIIGKLINSPVIQESCKRCAKMLENQNTLDNYCKIVEETL